MGIKTGGGGDRRMKKIITYLRSEACVFVAIVCVMLVQIAHNTYVVFANSRFQSSVLSLSFALFYAFAIEFSILTYVINDQRTHAKVYAGGSLATNLLYYYYPESILAPALISIMLAGSIWAFSDLFVDKINKEHREKKKSPDKPFKCDMCEASFDSGRELNGHRSAHKRVVNKLELEPINQ